MNDDEFLKQIRISNGNSSLRHELGPHIEMHIQRWFNPVRAQWYWKFTFFDAKYDFPCVTHWSNLRETIQYIQMVIRSRE